MSWNPQFDQEKRFFTSLRQSNRCPVDYLPDFSALMEIQRQQRPFAKPLRGSPWRGAEGRGVVKSAVSTFIAPAGAARAS